MKLSGKNIRGAKRGFTLMEIILAITLAVGAMAAVMAFYQHVLNVRQTIYGQMRVVSAQRLVMGRVTDELRGSLVYPFLQMGLRGACDITKFDPTSLNIQFVTAAVPGSLTLAGTVSANSPDSSAGAQRLPEYDLQIISYRLRVATDENGKVITDDQGNPIIDGLERTCQKVLPPAAIDASSIPSTLMAADIKYMNIRYWDSSLASAGGDAWVTTWNKPDLPLAVEITLGVQPLPPNITDPTLYPYETFRRVIYLPGGIKAMSGTIVLPSGDGSSGP